MKAKMVFTVTINAERRHLDELIALLYDEIEDLVGLLSSTEDIFLESRCMMGDQLDE